MKLIIVPDVHGRSFWQKAASEFPDEEFIFLGDYLDPYPKEGITSDDAVSGLEEILAFRNQHPGKVTLLLGNHDLHYLHDGFKGSRFDRVNAVRYVALFRQNIDAFQMAYEKTVSDRRYFFTHAGLCGQWLKRFAPDLTEENLSADFFNQSYPKPSFIDALSDVSHYRWGPAESGSMVWADLAEHGLVDNQLYSIVQVFGHTMIPMPFNFDDRIYCLDCQRCFYLDLENGGICDLETDALIPAIGPDCDE